MLEFDSIGTYTEIQNWFHYKTIIFNYFLLVSLEDDWRARDSRKADIL